MPAYHEAMAGVDSGTEPVLTDRLTIARADMEANARRLSEVLQSAMAVHEAAKTRRGARARQHDMAYGRLEARLTTVPVIEQAKGVLMARHGCPSDQAADMLRSMSRGTGVPLADVAAKIVAQASRSRSPRPGSWRPGTGDQI